MSVHAIQQCICIFRCGLPAYVPWINLQATANREFGLGFGRAIFLCFEAFMVICFHEMSYWGSSVIVNLFAAIPFIGPDLALLIRVAIRSGRCNLEPILRVSV
jgi:hypothetical protein